MTDNRRQFISLTVNWVEGPPVPYIVFVDAITAFWGNPDNTSTVLYCCGNNDERKVIVNESMFIIYDLLTKRSID